MSVSPLESTSEPRMMTQVQSQSHRRIHQPELAHHMGPGPRNSYYFNIINQVPGSRNKFLNPWCRNKRQAGLGVLGGSSRFPPLLGVQRRLAGLLQNNSNINKAHHTPGVGGGFATESHLNSVSKGAMAARPLSVFSLLKCVFLVGFTALRRRLAPSFKSPK